MIVYLLKFEILTNVTKVIYNLLIFEQLNIPEDDHEMF